MAFASNPVCLPIVGHKKSALTYLGHPPLLLSPQPGGFMRTYILPKTRLVSLVYGFRGFIAEYPPFWFSSAISNGPIPSGLFPYTLYISIKMPKSSASKSCGRVVFWGKGINKSSQSLCSLHARPGGASFLFFPKKAQRSEGAPELFCACGSSARRKKIARPPRIPIRKGLRSSQQRRGRTTCAKKCAGPDSPAWCWDRHFKIYTL